VQAAELAISSPLLEASIDGAHGVLLSIQGGSDLGLFEINEAARLVQEAAHPEANIIFGAVIDDALGDEVRVTVIAAGFDGGAPVRRADDRALGTIQGRSIPAPSPAPTNNHAPAPSAHPSPAPSTDRPGPSAPSGDEPVVRSERVEAPFEPARAHASPPPPRTVTFDENDDLDVPDFLK
jgi:cell division protein FtsZ